VTASVIVPAYNARTTITGCLAALTAQRTRAAFEVIVVDSSDDGTGELVRARFPGVRLVALARRTLPGAARNVGVEVARGEILAFTDADCVPEPTWLDAMLREHAAGAYAAVGGAVLNAKPRAVVAWCDYLVEFSAQLPSAGRRLVDMLPTCNLSVPRQVFARYGPFPATVPASEDRLFCWRLARAGERLLFEPGIRVRHVCRARLGAYLRHQRGLGRGAAAARLRVDLPQAWLARGPARVLAPLLRLLVLEARLLRRDRPNFVRFNALLPLCLLGLAAWGIGFCEGGAPAAASAAARCPCDPR